jgi:hypothetical protein
LSCGPRENTPGRIGGFPADAVLCRRAAAGLDTAVNYVAELRSTIRRIHDCEVAHSRTEVVREIVNGLVVWDGRVEVFALCGHDRALRCYAWGHQHESGRWEVTTVLAIPPVISASTAVLAALAAKLRNGEAGPAGPGANDEPV